MRPLHGFADPFTGMWRLNTGGSQLPFEPPRSVVLQIAATEDAVSLTENSLDAAGAAEIVTIHARFDGLNYPVEGSALVDSFAIERLDRRTWKATGSRKGVLIFTELITLSEDGATFREDAETTLADGARATATLLYERQ
ncbi:MAG TPA: hypothetical protein VN428_12425 [Bryobacteraceae bacterium]|nr:hypothetical protein [Bryobacteraceae bacterium]